jgi:hypothetical protein
VGREGVVLPTCAPDRSPWCRPRARCQEAACHPVHPEAYECTAATPWEPQAPTQMVQTLRTSRSAPPGRPDRPATARGARARTHTHTRSPGPSSIPPTPATRASTSRTTGGGPRGAHAGVSLHDGMLRPYLLQPIRSAAHRWAVAGGDSNVGLSRPHELDGPWG